MPENKNNNASLYGQCQIYSTEPMTCPLCRKEVTPGVGHYCEIRNGKTSVDGKKVPNGK